MVEFLQQQSLDSALFLNRGANATYSSKVIFIELMECLIGVSEQQLKTELNQSAFIGIGIDESTDRASEKHLALIARYVSRDAICKTVFKDCVSVPDGKALTVVAATYNYEELSPTHLERFTEIAAALALDTVQVQEPPRDQARKNINQILTKQQFH